MSHIDNGFFKRTCRKNKKKFPEAKELHEALDNKDESILLGLLNQAIMPHSDTVSEWFKMSILDDPRTPKDFSF